MKETTVISSILLWLVPNLFGQVPGHLNALNTAGKSVKLDVVTYTYSVGETAAFNHSCTYTPGVIQPTCICLVPIAEVFDQKFKAVFSPNPANDHVVVETDYSDFANYSLIGMGGKIVKNERFLYAPISLMDVPAGTYLLRLSSADNQIFKTVKIIKQ